MSNQIVISSGAKVRELEGVLTGTSGIVSSVPLGAANGVATLDSGGKVPVSQLPSSVVTYLGTWNAATNTPTLANGTGDAGDMYICNVAGTVNFGAGPVVFVVGDWVLYGSGTWQKSSGQNGTVTSVAVTESGDSLNITGSPITTSGTINIGFNGTNLQYVNGAGNLTTFPILTGYVPYTGATTNVNLGTNTLQTARIGIGTTPNATVTLDVHRAGTIVSRIENTNANEDTLFAYASNGDNVWFNGIDYDGGNYNFGFYYSPDGTNVYRKAYFNNVGSLTAYSFIKTGGTSSQFLKADGSVDSSTYALDSAVVHNTGNETVGGTKTFSDATKNNGGIFLQNASSNSLAGYMNLGGLTNGVKFTSGGGITNNFTLPSATGYDYTFPNLTGTIAMLEGTQTFTGGKTFDAAYFNGAEFINTAYFDKGLWLVKNGIPSVFTSLQTTIYSEATSNNVIFRDNLSKAKLIFNNSTQTYTFPNATGTLALTSDIPSITGLVPYTGATGAVNLGFNSLTTNAISLDGNSASGLLNIKSNSTLSGGTAGYVSLISGNSNQLSIWFGGGNIATFTGVTLSSSRTYTLPDATGTIALVGGSGVGTVTSVAALTIGTSGTDLSSSVANSTTTPVITLNVPTASATNRGALSSADWTTFNNKQSALTNPVTGTGTTNYLPKFTGASTIGNSIVSESGGALNINGSVTMNGSMTIQSSGVTRGFFGDVDGDNNIQLRSQSAITFKTGGNNLRATLDASGNLGLGVTPSDWFVVYKALQIGSYGAAISGQTNDEALVLWNNAYPNASNVDTYTATKAANKFQMAAGFYKWFSAPSGTGAITWTQAMTLTASGRLLIGTPTEATYMLDVNGTGRFSGQLNIIVPSGTAKFQVGDGSVSGGSFINLMGVYAAKTWFISSNYNLGGGLEFIQSTTNGGTTPSSSAIFSLASTGAATFSSRINGVVGGTAYNTAGLWLQGSNSTDGIAIGGTGGGDKTIDTYGGTLKINGTAGNGLSVTGAATFSSSVTATSFFESSSIKGKDIIATNPLLALDIDVIKYTRKSDESKDIRYGYSAEQIHSLMPELTDKDVTAVKYLDVHTILISQLQQEIKELKAKMN